MMDTIYSFVSTEPSETIVGFCSAFVALLSLVMFSQLSHLKKRVKKEQDLLEKRLRIVTSSAVGMGEKIVQLEERLSSSLLTQQQAGETEAQFSYTQALKLIESGVDNSIVMSSSGLSESEVNLMEMLHQTKRGSFSVP